MRQRSISVTKHTTSPEAARPDGRKGPRKVLILSAPVGSGHRMASFALAGVLRSLPNADLTVEEGDVFRLLPDWLGRGLLGLYGLILRRCPSLYALSYRWGNVDGRSLWLRNVVNGLLCRLARPWLDRIAPDIVVSTHGTPTGIVSLYKRKYKSSLRLAVVVTDFTVHRWLLCPAVDTYFVAHADLVPLLRKGVPAGEKPQIGITGIPVRPDFAVPPGEAERQALRRGQGWQDEEFVCVLIGGGDGLLPMEGFVRLLGTPGLEALRLVAVTGRNGALRRRLEALRQRPGVGARLTVYGSLSSPAPLYQAADLVLSKGGGVTVAETLATGIPLVLFRPLPGQEEKNSAFLMEHGMARRADTVAEAAACIAAEMAVPAAERARQRRLRRDGQGHPAAAREIAFSLIYM